MATSTSLRAITHRLTATPVKQLPQVALHLASSISDCGKILSAPQSQKGSKTNSETALLVHKLKTRLTSLLQDRSFEGRWTGVILVKAAVEAGQWELLHGCEPWIRGLMAILGKPDPMSTKKMCIITLTRIFHLTHQYQTLVRELTTPSLPSFITACMNLVSVKSSSGPTRKLKPNTPLLGTILHALLELIPRHPTIFRPFSSQIHSLILPLIGSASTMSQPDADLVINLSQRLFISLHHCAPKNTTGDEWAVACKSTVHAIHRTADHLFRAVVEQWESTDVTRNQSQKPQRQGGIVRDDGPDPLGLPGWQGIEAGAERLSSLLKLLAQFMSLGTNATVSIPVGLVLDMTSRLNSLTVPFEDADGLQNTIQFNPEIGKDERESLVAELPGIHSVTLNLLSSMAETFEDGTAPVGQGILEQTLWVFEAEKFSKDLRASTYHLLGILLPILGPSMSKSSVSALTPTIQSCCHDLLPPPTTGHSQEQPSSESKPKTNARPVSTNADSFLSSKPKNFSTTTTTALLPGLQIPASKFLPCLLQYLPIEHISNHLRAEIDRTAILTNNRKAMVASVINPGLAIKGRRENPSIAPFLARSCPAELEVESFLRPRMPVLLRGSLLRGKMFDVEGSEEEDSEPTNTKRGTTSGNMFIDSPLSSSTMGVSRDIQMASSIPNKRSYPIDSSSGEPQPPLSTQNDQDSGSPRSKTPRFTNGNDTSVETREFAEPAVSTGSITSITTSVQPVARPDASIPHSTAPSTHIDGVTTAPISSADTAAPSLSVTGNESSRASSSANQLAEMISTARKDSASAGDGNDVPQAPGHGDVGDESSGDEIPTLDIEPDTDDDMDEDMEMEG